MRSPDLFRRKKSKRSIITDGKAEKHKLMLPLLSSECCRAAPMAQSMIVTRIADTIKKSIFLPEYL